MRVAYDVIVAELIRVLSKYDLPRTKVELLARQVADASRDGVPSHGLNFFPGLIQSLNKGTTNPLTEPEYVDAAGIVQRYDARHGIGPLCAHFCMERAIEDARENGMGCVTLKDNNHWLRAGNYGWQAAEAGCIGICWTNTIPNMPPWGAKTHAIGNNPIVFAFPRKSGHLVLDMAISQFSYGRTWQYRSEGRQFPVPGGYDAQGNLTIDPAAVAKSGRHLPIGYWKGSGLAIMLDIVVALLSGGLATHEMKNTGRSFAQIFIAFDAERFAPADRCDTLAEELIAEIHAAEPAGEGERIFYPGERSLLNRQESMSLGVSVDDKVWDQIRAL